MKIIKNGTVVTEACELENKIIVFDDRIVAIDNEENIGSYRADEVIDADGGIISPGLVDMHIHGFLGNDASDGDKEGLAKFSRDLLKNGVTSFLPTTMTIPLCDLEKALDVARELKKEGTGGAEILGVNAEGPFISEKKKGAQKAENIRKPDADFLLKHKDIIKITTIAPEAEGAVACTKKVCGNSDIIVSIGHCDANYEETMALFQAGARQATHLYNAMPACQHRNLTAADAALRDDRVYCELIADTFHVAPEKYESIYRQKLGKIILISDCTRAGGMPEGEYDLGGQLMKLTGIACLLPDGTIAGSVLRLNKAIYNFEKYTGRPLHEVINLATKNPCDSMHLSDRGTL